MKKILVENNIIYIIIKCKKLSSLINSMKLLVGILENIKDYITLYYKEISGNPYITPNIKI